MIPFAVLLLASASLAAPLPALVKDINTLKDPEARSSPSQFQVLDGIAYFRAMRDFGAELWRSDGTPEGTFRVHAIEPVALTATANRLFFVGVDA